MEIIAGADVDDSVGEHRRREHATVQFHAPPLNASRGVDGMKLPRAAADVDDAVVHGGRRGHVSFGRKLPALGTGVGIESGEDAVDTTDVRCIANHDGGRCADRPGVEYPVYDDRCPRDWARLRSAMAGIAPIHRTGIWGGESGGRCCGL